MDALQSESESTKRATASESTSLSVRRLVSAPSLLTRCPVGGNEVSFLLSHIVVRQTFIFLFDQADESSFARPICNSIRGEKRKHGMVAAGNSAGGEPTCRSAFYSSEKLTVTEDADYFYVEQDEDDVLKTEEIDDARHDVAAATDQKRRLSELEVPPPSLSSDHLICDEQLDWTVSSTGAIDDGIENIVISDDDVEVVDAPPSTGVDVKKTVFRYHSSPAIINDGCGSGSG